MSWKAFVLGHHPDAVCEQIGDSLGWEVWVRLQEFGYGRTPAQAWRNAAQYILQRSQP